MAPNKWTSRVARASGESFKPTKSRKMGTFFRYSSKIMSINKTGNSGILTE
jgi:hypothetical protein